MREPEEDEEGLALEVLVAERLAVLVDQTEGAADGGGLNSPGSGAAAAHKENDAEAHHQPGDERREHHYQPRGPCAHALTLMLRRCRAASKQNARPATIISKNTALP